MMVLRPKIARFSHLFGPLQHVTLKRSIGGEAVEATLRLQNGSVEIVYSPVPLFVITSDAYRYQDREPRIRLEADGFTRMFTRKGSLQSIYGSDDTVRMSSV